jgi:hypothetical protein
VLCMCLCLMVAGGGAYRDRPGVLILPLRLHRDAAISVCGYSHYRLASPTLSDACENIREITVKELGKWVRHFGSARCGSSLSLIPSSSLFLNDGCTKYLGWSLNDKAFLCIPSLRL